MPRNAEVIRQWTILREIERARAAGVTVDELATSSGKTTRTIRRDLQALEESGFPIFDDRSRDDGKTRWFLNGQAFKGLAAGLTLSELCALYFSGAMLSALAGTPFKSDLDRAFDKLASALTPHMKAFLDRLPRVVAAKPDPLRRRMDGEADGTIASTLLEATLHLRQATFAYYSRSSERTKHYLTHPYRLAYAQGGLYLLAYVPEYGEVRTFAVERIEEVSLLEEHFTPIEELPDQAFPHSLGVHSGTPEPIVIDFEPAVADYVRARDWHATQTFDTREDGILRMRLTVCRDAALTSWVLSFGPFARVASPDTLARDIAGQLQEASARYAHSPDRG